MTARPPAWRSAGAIRPIAAGTRSTSPRTVGRWGACRRAARELQAQVLAPLDPEERDVLLELLTRIAEEGPLAACMTFGRTGAVAAPRDAAAR